MSQNNTPIQPDPTPDSWVLPFRQGYGYAVKETCQDRGPNRQVRLRFSGFNHPNSQTEVGVFSAAEPKMLSRTLLYSFIDPKTDSIRSDDEKGSGKSNHGMPMIGFRSVLPLIAQRSTETLIKTTNVRGKKLDLFQHLQAAHTVFPFPVQDPAVGGNSRPGRQMIGPLVSFAQTGQDEAHFLPILPSKRSGIQREKTADILERAVSDDMPFLDPKRAEIIESPVSRQLNPSVVQTVRQASVVRGNDLTPGVPATETVSSEMTVGGANPSQTPPSNTDVDELVEKIWRKFNRKLTLEQERGGYGKWL